MIQIITLILSEVAAIWILLERGDSQFLQILLFSQSWIVVVSLPFIFRSETHLTVLKNKIIPATVGLLILGVVGGAWWLVRDASVSTYVGVGQNFIGHFNELFFVMGVIVAVATLMASAILRADK